MALFKKDYSKPGPGVPKNAPKKKGFARFFEILGRDFGNLVKLNLTYQLCLLPAQLFFAAFFFLFIMGDRSILMLLFGLIALGASVLVGPATTSAFYLISKMLRDDPGFIWHDFWERFKINFKCTAVPGILYSVVVASQVFATFIFMAGGTSWIMIAVYVFAFIIVGMAIPYFFIQSGYIDLKASGILKNSFLLSIGKFPRSFMGFLMHSVLTLVLFSFIHITFLVVIFIGYSIPMLLCLMWVWPPIDSTFKIEETLNKRKSEEITENLEASGWVDENADSRESNKY